MRILLILLFLGTLFYFKDKVLEFVMPQEIYSVAPTTTRLNVNSQPIQLRTGIPGPIPFKGGTMTFLASYQVTAKVLSRKDYPETLDTEGVVSPFDLALGWVRMAEPAVVSGIKVVQANRAYYLTAPKNMFPIPIVEVFNYSANTTIIPANRSVAREIDKIEKGQIVTLKGFLVSYRKNLLDAKVLDMQSSQSRTDTGPASREILYVEHVIIHY